MILMWLGPLVVLFAGLEIFRRSGSALGARLQERFLALKPPLSDFGLFVSTKLCAFSQGSLLQNQYTAVALLNGRVSSRRFALVLLCLSSVGSWTTLAGICLAWQLSGFYLLSVALPIYLVQFWTGRGQKLLRVVFGVGLFLLGAEWALRQQSILLSILGESDLHFLLADGRLPAQMLWAGVTFVLTAIIGFESWAVFLAVILVAAGSLSINGALGMFFGELLAHTCLLVWRSRKLNADTRVLVKGYAVSSSLGLVVGFVLAGFVRDVFVWGFTFDASPLAEKSLQLAILFLLMTVSKMVFAMVWGHFAAKKGPDEVQAGLYFSHQWLDRGWISPRVMSFLRQRLGTRLRDLRQQITAVEETRSKLPAGLLKMHDEEIQQISIWLQQSDKGREKF